MTIQLQNPPYKTPHENQETDIRVTVLQMKKQSWKKPICLGSYLQTRKASMNSKYSFRIWTLYYKRFCLLFFWHFCYFFLWFLYAFSKYSPSYINDLDIGSMGKMQELRNVWFLLLWTWQLRVNFQMECYGPGKLEHWIYQSPCEVIYWIFSPPGDLFAPGQNQTILNIEECPKQNAWRRSHLTSLQVDTRNLSVWLPHLNGQAL